MYIFEEITTDITLYFSVTFYAQSCLYIFFLNNGNVIFATKLEFWWYIRLVWIKQMKRNNSFNRRNICLKWPATRVTNKKTKMMSLCKTYKQSRKPVVKYYLVVIWSFIERKSFAVLRMVLEKTPLLLWRHYYCCFIRVKTGLKRRILLMSSLFLTHIWLRIISA